MAAVFGVICALAFLWSAVKYQMVYVATIDSLPPQFQDELNSRYAFPVYALAHSTPLELQAEYIKRQMQRLTEQARELGESASKAAKDAATPKR